MLAIYVHSGVTLAKLPQNTKIFLAWSRPGSPLNRANLQSGMLLLLVESAVRLCISEKEPTWAVLDWLIEHSSDGRASEGPE